MERLHSAHLFDNSGPTSPIAEKRESSKTFSSTRGRGRGGQRFNEGNSRSKGAPKQPVVNTNTPFPTSTKISDQKEKDSSSKNKEPLRSGVIGLGRSTGISRVPNLELSKSPTLMASTLQALVNRVRNLEDDQKFLVGAGDDMQVGAFASEKTLAEWESILARYRQLTMAITASSSTAVRRLAIPVYEGAADACLLGGNLSFYLSCQTRLLQDLYNQSDDRSLALSRRSEFMSYSFLYFGVFHEDRCELARLMRSLPNEIVDNPRVKLALSAVNAAQKRNGLQFIRIYKTCDIRQRTLMNSRLSSMRVSALAALIRAYHALERDFALSLLGLRETSDFLLLLKAESPALADHNCAATSEFRFRLPATRTTVVK